MRTGSSMWSAQFIPGSIARLAPHGRAMTGRIANCTANAPWKPTARSATQAEFFLVTSPRGPPIAFISWGLNMNCRSPESELKILSGVRIVQQHPLPGRHKNVTAFQTFNFKNQSSKIRSTGWKPPDSREINATRRRGPSQALIPPRPACVCDPHHKKNSAPESAANAHRSRLVVVRSALDCFGTPRRRRSAPPRQATASRVPERCWWSAVEW